MEEESRTDPKVGTAKRWLLALLVTMLAAGPFQLSINVTEPIAVSVPRAHAAGNTVIYITSTASTTWTVPSDWNNSSNTIELIGGGGGGATAAANQGGAAGGGGGGAYAKITNFSTSTGIQVKIQVGKGGAANASGTISYFAWSGSGSTSTCSGTTMQLCAMPGGGGLSPSNAVGIGGSGGASSTSVGSTKAGGGDGGGTNTYGGGNSGVGGGGGGGAAGCGATNCVSASPGADGNLGGTTGSGSITGSTGGTGDGSFGGGGGGADTAGIAGTEFNGTSIGSGGGGGGGSGGGNRGAGSNGQPGGNYGSGGGGGGEGGKNGSPGGTGGSGMQGIIVITYTPAAAGPTTLTIANGTRSADTTIAPGSFAATSSVFTFATDAGTSTISTVTVKNSTTTGVYQIQVTNNAGTTVYGSSTNPTASTTVIDVTKGGSMNVSSSATTFATRIVPMTHANMPAPPGANYIVTSTVSTWTDAKSLTPAGSNTTSSIVIIDNQSPAEVTGTSTTPGSTQVVLNWTNPGGDFSNDVIIRTTSTPVTGNPAEGSSPSIGSTIGNGIVMYISGGTSVTDTGLSRSTAYYYKIFTKDTNGNYSANGVALSATTSAGGITIADGTRPADVTIAPSSAAATSSVFTLTTDLGTSTISTVTVKNSTTTGVYQIQVTNSAGTTVYGSSTNPIASTTVIDVTKGGSMNVSSSATTFATRIVPMTHANMPGTPGANYIVTSTVSTWTDPKGFSPQGSNTTSSIITIDNASPANVSGASGSAGNTQVSFSWTNPGDSDFATTTILRATSSITVTPAEGADYSVGNAINASTTVVCRVNSASNSCIDSGLTNGTAYYYKIFTEDIHQNYSTGAVPGGNPFTPASDTIKPNRPILNSPAPNATTSAANGIFQMTATDLTPNNIQYQISICQNEACTQIVQSSSQAVSQTGWSGQNASSGKEYASGQTGTFTLQTPLTASTTYYYSAQAIDPEGSNSFGASSVTRVDNTWNTSPNQLPINDYGLSAVTWNGYVYVTGGNASGTATSSVFWAPINADGSPGIWSVSPNKMPSPLYIHSSVVSNGYIYVMGGNTGSSVTSSVFWAPINADGSPGTWSTSPNRMPSPLDLGFAVVSNGYIYVPGGFTGSFSTSSVFYVPINADGSPGVWSVSPNKLPMADYEYRAAVANGYVYVTGGNNGSVATSSVFYAPVNADGSPGAWSVSPNQIPIPFGEELHSTFIANGYIYVEGGGVTATSSVFYAPVNADGSPGVWSTSPNQMPAALYSHAAVFSNGYTYVLGGVANGTATSSVFYSQINVKGQTASEGWKNQAPLPTRIMSESATTYNGYIYEIGGQTASGVSTTTVRYASVSASGTIGSWANATALPALLYGDAAAASNGYLYVTGGTSDGVTSTSTIQYAQINSDGALGTWQNTTALPVADVYHAATIYNSRLYVTGGGTTSTVFYASINANGTVGSWNSATKLPGAAVSNNSIAAYAGYLYLMGGWTSAATSSVFYAPINADGSLGSWKNAANLPTPISSHSGAFYNGYLYVVGGFTGSSVTSTVLYSAIGPSATASGTISSWLIAAPLPGAVEQQASVAANGYLFAIGGSPDGLAATSTVQSIGLYTGSIPFSTPPNATAATGTLAVNPDPGGQEPNKFDIGQQTSLTGIQLINFQASSSFENINISQIVFNLSNVTGFTSSDVTSTELYIDYNGDGTLGAGETTTVMSSGTTAISGKTGTITFAGSVTVTSTLNLILKANVTNIDRGDWFTLSLSGSGITATGASSSGAIVPTGSVSVNQFKPWRMGSSIPSDSNGAPIVQILTGGTPAGSGAGSVPSGGGAPAAPNQGGGVPGGGSGGSPTIFFYFPWFGSFWKWFFRILGSL